MGAWGDSPSPVSGSNVLLDAKQHAKLADFDLAPRGRWDHRITASVRSLAFTPPRKSPGGGGWMLGPPICFPRSSPLPLAVPQF